MNKWTYFQQIPVQRHPLYCLSCHAFYDSTLVCETTTQDQLEYSRFELYVSKIGLCNSSSDFVKYLSSCYYPVLKLAAFRKESIEAMFQKYNFPFYFHLIDAPITESKTITTTTSSSCLFQVYEETVRLGGLAVKEARNLLISFPSLRPARVDNPKKQYTNHSLVTAAFEREVQNTNALSIDDMHLCMLCFDSEALLETAIEYRIRIMKEFFVGMKKTLDEDIDILRFPAIADRFLTQTATLVLTIAMKKQHEFVILFALYRVLALAIKWRWSSDQFAEESLQSKRKRAKVLLEKVIVYAVSKHDDQRKVN